jgi:pimeloyl-ACP methyl ester carboxylesterase
MGGDEVPQIITESTSIDYDIHGEGPPLILINGLGFGRWAWFKQIPAFSRHFSTVTFDVRGNGACRTGSLTSAPRW